ncbi:MAG: hypothetical protein I4O49_11190 [Janthinobacterium lividum]|jgi:hypothetical protein|nr:hypothetical protein [Janthinobacterium lividum]
MDGRGSAPAQRFLLFLDGSIDYQNARLVADVEPLNASNFYTQNLFDPWGA